jgi:hypothetical protein
MPRFLGREAKNKAWAKQTGDCPLRSEARAETGLSPLCGLSIDTGGDGTAGENRD